MLDTVRDITTPELIEIRLHPAGFLPRGFAFFIDTILRWLLMLLIAIPSMFIGDLGIGLFLISIFLIEWFYPVFFEVVFKGKTPGKRLVGLKVLNDKQSNNFLDIRGTVYSSIGIMHFYKAEHQKSIPYFIKSTNYIS